MSVPQICSMLATALLVVSDHGEPLAWVPLPGDSYPSTPVAESSPKKAIEIVGERVVPAGRLARLRVVDAPANSTIKWKVSPASQVDVAESAHGTIQFTALPGRYAVCAMIGYVVDGSVVVEDVSVVVEFALASTAPPAAPPAAPRLLPPGGAPGRTIEEAKRAIGRLQIGNSLCTAVVTSAADSLGNVDVLTAAHCVPVGAVDGVLRLPGGHVVPCRVLVVARDVDVAWLVGTASGPIDYLELGADDLRRGDAVLHSGYGFDKPGNVERGHVEDIGGPASKSTFRLSVSNGDSGGPIMCEKTLRVHSVVCCTSNIAGPGRVSGGSLSAIKRLAKKS